MATTSGARAEADRIFYSAEADSLAERLRRVDSLDDLEQFTDIPQTLFRLREITKHHHECSFPRPRRLWSFSKLDGASEWDCLRFLAPVKDKQVAQIGGNGIWAISFALAGAREAWLISPFDAELDAGREIARLAGVRLECKLCPAEHLTFPGDYFDAIFAPASAHHFDEAAAFPEIRRVLRPGGKFAAFEPWRTPVYQAGVQIFGKRERNVLCIPLDSRRVLAFQRSFPHARVRHHGSLTRYPLILLERLIRVSESFVWSILRWDDAISTSLGWRRFGSGVALLAKRSS